MSNTGSDDIEKADLKAILRRRRICVVIPTYNNAGTVADVAERSMNLCEDVFVICDGCTDDTANLLRRMPHPPVIVELEKNKGKGRALKEGFRHALESGFSYAITIDGDGQHFPEDIPVMLEANRNNPGALVIGSRKGLDKVERSSGSRFANAFSNFWFTVQTWKKLDDTQTGFRLYPLKKLSGLRFLTSRYEAELELLVFAAWSGVEIVSVPVRVYYPSQGERVSHFRPLRDFARITLLNVTLCCLAVVYGYPRSILRWLCAMVRTLFILLTFIIVTIFLATPATFIYMNVSGDAEHKKKVLHKYIQKLARIALYGLPGIRYTLSNPQGEDFSRPAVIICNHQSHLDLLPILAISDKFVVLTTDWVWNDPFYGYVIRKAEYLPASAGMEVMMPRLESLVSRGYSIVVFPEGTRSRDLSLGRFHQGAFFIARFLKLDVIPLVLYGFGKVLPKHGRTVYGRPVRMAVDRRIPQCEMTSFGGTTREQASYMREYYRKRYNELADEFEQDNE